MALKDKLEHKMFGFETKTICLMFMALFEVRGVSVAGLQKGLNLWLMQAMLHAHASMATIKSANAWKKFVFLARPHSGEESNEAFSSAGI